MLPHCSLPTCGDLGTRGDGMRESTPLYHRLKAELLDSIQNGTWQAGDILPSEPELARMFRVSRTTVRQAIGDLAASGYVVRQQGRGTFVAQRSKSLTASRLYGFAEELSLRGYNPEVRVHSVQHVPCGPEIAHHLELDIATPVIQIVRTAHVDGYCMFREVSHLVAPFHVHIEDLSKHVDIFENIYGFLEQNGVKIALGKQFVRAQTANSMDQEVFGITAADAVLVVVRLTQDESGAPVQYSEVRYSGHRYDYEINLLRNI